MRSHQNTASNIAYTSIGHINLGYLLACTFMGKDTTKHHQNIPKPSCHGNPWVFSISRLSHRTLHFWFFLLLSLRKLPLTTLISLWFQWSNKIKTCSERANTRTVTSEFLLPRCARCRNSWYHALGKSTLVGRKWMSSPAVEAILAPESQRSL